MLAFSFALAVGTLPSVPVGARGIEGGPESGDTTSVDLQQAVASGYVDAYISGLSSQAYYGESLRIELASRVAYDLSVVVEVGVMFIPEDSGYQTMVGVKSASIYVEAYASATEYLYAFCSELHDAPPNGYLAFDVGSKASGDLLRVVQEVDGEGAWNEFGGQLAVWQVTDQITESEAREYGASDHDVRRANAILDGAGTGDRIGSEGTGGGRVLGGGEGGSKGTPGPAAGLVLLASGVGLAGWGKRRGRGPVGAPT